MTQLKQKIAKNGLRVLFNGSLAASGATVVGHFPWFFTFNALNEAVRRSFDGVLLANWFTACSRGAVRAATFCCCMYRMCFV